jgi:hypothetical protein
MIPASYTACIGDSFTIVENASYESLVRAILTLTLRAATARSADESEWEHEELRRRGLGSVQVFRDHKALWTDRQSFQAELDEAEREHVADRFKAINELDPAFFEELDRDLRVLWRLAGYDAGSLSENMKSLFVELESDANDCAAKAREALIEEILASARPA